MYPHKVNMKIYQGQDYNILLRLERDGQKVDATNWDIRAVVRRDKFTNEVVFPFEVRKGNGFVNLSVDDTVTNAIEMRSTEEKYVYDVLATYRDVKMYLAYGTVKLVKAVSNR